MTQQLKFVVRDPIPLRSSLDKSVKEINMSSNNNIQCFLIIASAPTIVATLIIAKISVFAAKKVWDVIVK